MIVKSITYIILFAASFLSFGQNTPHHHDHIEEMYHNKSLGAFVKALQLNENQKNDTELFAYINDQYQSFFQNVLKELKADEHYGDKSFESDYQNLITHLKSNLPASKKAQTKINSKVLNGPCTNIDFENGNLNGWELTTGDVDGSSEYSYINETPASPSAFHQIMGSGVDNVTGIPTNNPLTGNFSVRLGDGTGIGAKAARMRQTFKVDANNYLFTYSYAVIFESPNDHLTNELPYFTVRVFDMNGNNVPCGEYSVVANSQTAQTYQSTIFNGNVVLYKNWQTVFTNLENYIGQNIVVEFTSGDCSKTGHFGYCFIDANCSVDNLTTSNQLICKGDSALLTAPSGADNYLWSNGATTQSTYVYAGGTYSCTITPFQGSGCSVTLDIDITEQPSPLADFGSYAFTACRNESIQFDNQSTIPAPGVLSQYRWDFGDGSISPIGNNSNINTNKTIGTYQTPIHTYTSTGIYNVEILTIAANGCRDSITKTVQVFEPPTVTASPNPTVCDGEFVTLEGFGAANYQWTNGVQNGVAFKPSLGQKNYRVIGFDANGCRDTAYSTVTVNPIPSVYAGPDQFVCENENFTLTATLGSIYVWSHGNPNGSSMQQVIGTQSYWVRAEENNCFNFDTLNVTVHPSTLTDAGNGQHICAEDLSALTATTNNGQNPTWYGGNGTFSSPNAFSSNYTPSASEVNQGGAMLYFECKSPFGCPKAIDSIFIEINHFVQDLIVNTSPITCFGYNDGTVSLQLNTPVNGPFDYTLDDLITSSQPAFTQLTPGQHFIRITNSINCDTLVYFTIIEPSSVQVEVIDLQNIHCSGNNTGAITVLGSGGTGSIAYQWSNSGNTPEIDSLFAGLYSVEVSDQNNCAVQLDTILIEPLPLIAKVSNLPVQCFGFNTTISALVQGGTAPYELVWNTGQTALNIEGPAGNYLCQVKDAKECKTRDSISFGEPPILEIKMLSDTTVCSGSSFQLLTLATGGTLPYLYEWPGFGSSNFNFLSVELTASTEITSLVRDANDCVVDTKGQFYVYSHPSENYQTLVSDTEICEQDSVVVDVVYSGQMPLNSIKWLDCETCIFPRTIYPTGDTTLYTQLISKCSDTITTPISINIIERPLLDVFFETPQICPYELLTIEAQVYNPEEWEITWDMDNGIIRNGSTVSISYPSPGIYQVNVSALHQTGCLYEGTYTDSIQVLEVAVADFEADYYERSFFEPVFNFTNLSTNATSYQWDFMDGNSSTLTNPTHTYDQFGEFNVQLIATNAIGCSDTIVKIVEVIPDFNIYAPNTFTPDNNQHNQNFCLKGYGISDEGYYLSIFNRWGEIVFEGYHITEEWDGVTPNGEIAKDGPYVWKVKFRSVAGNTYEKIGHVNLLK